MTDREQFLRELVRVYQSSENDVRDRGFLALLEELHRDISAFVALQGSVVYDDLLWDAIEKATQKAADSFDLTDSSRRIRSHLRTSWEWAVKDVLRKRWRRERKVGPPPRLRHGGPGQDENFESIPSAVEPSPFDNVREKEEEALLVSALGRSLPSGFELTTEDWAKVLLGDSLPAWKRRILRKLDSSEVLVTSVNADFGSVTGNALWKRRLWTRLLTSR